MIDFRSLTVERSLEDTEEESDCINPGRTLNETSQGRDQAPYGHASRQIDRRMNLSKKRRGTRAE